jgi:DNA-binding beta-propeller fold protein YncE/mono/diheme cytochrome c family protein
MNTSPRARQGTASFKTTFTCAALFATALPLWVSQPVALAATDPDWHGLSSLAIHPQSSRLYVAGERSGVISELLLPQLQKARSMKLPGSISGLVASESNQSLLLTLTSPSARLVCLDMDSYRERFSASAGSGACAPVVAPRSNRIYVCNRFDNTVGIHSLTTGMELGKIRMLREPVAACLSAAESLLIVANHLPETAANLDQVSAAVSLVHLDDTNLTRHVRLPNGSTSLRGLCTNPDGTLCAVVHNVARFQVAAVQVEHGWMNVSALSLIDLKAERFISTVLLDDKRSGAANPWSVAWTPDGSRLLIAHAGTHELSIIDAPVLLRRLAAQPKGQLVGSFEFLKGIRRRLSLPMNGPRSVQTLGSMALVTGFFSDTVSIVDLEPQKVFESITLSDTKHISRERLGEQLFHDATIAHQSWQSCASCHPDGRTDSLNWDLLNDGIGNPKNTKSLVGSHSTSPAMWTGVRRSAETAVRSGLRHILFALRPEADAVAIDEYLKSLRPVASPYLVGGKNLSDPARRGKEIFAAAGCATCHPPGLFTDMKSHDVGTGKGGTSKSLLLDTPTLVELWRTTPYLHDGSAATIREVITARNPKDLHGQTSALSTEDIDALCAYLLSL